MDENTSIASKASCIVLGLNRSGRKFGTGSSVGQPKSPYFNNQNNLPLADVTNFYMENMEKVPFKCDIARTRMISSKDVSKHKVKTKTKKHEIASKMGQSNENFFDNLLKNMDENLKKTRGLSTSGVNKLPQKKKKNLCNDATLKLINDFKETFKGTKANTIPFTVTNDENAVSAQLDEIGLKNDDQGSLSTPTTLEKIPYIQKYSSVNANYDDEDLFDLSLLQTSKHSIMNQSSSIETCPVPSKKMSQSKNYSVSNGSWTTEDADYNSFITSSFDSMLTSQQAHDDSKMLIKVDASPSMFSLDSPNHLQSHHE